MKRSAFFLYVSAICFHNYLALLNTDNGSGLTLGWSGTPQFTVPTINYLARKSSTVRKIAVRAEPRFW